MTFEKTLGIRCFRLAQFISVQSLVLFTVQKRLCTRQSDTFAELAIKHLEKSKEEDDKMNLKQYVQDLFHEHEDSATSSMIGMQPEDSIISKTLIEIVKEAEKFGAQVITFKHVLDNPDSVVMFHRPDGKRQATPIPSDMVRPVVAHALWQINHQDPIFGKLGKMVHRSEAGYLDCRCWLENPRDITSIMIELISIESKLESQTMAGAPTTAVVTEVVAS